MKKEWGKAVNVRFELRDETLVREVARKEGLGIGLFIRNTVLKSIKA